MAQPKSKRAHARVVFHERGKDVETAWCVPLAKRGHYRLTNILFLHATPAYGDVIEAVEDDRFDGQLTCRRIVKPGGRHVAIIDYPKAAQFGKLTKLLRDRFGAECEGCFGPEAGASGRVYVALPARHEAKDVFAEVAAALPGLELIHPEPPRRKKKPAAAPVRNQKAAAPAEKSAEAKPVTLFTAIARDDLAAFKRAKPAELAAVDERKRSLLFVAVLEGRTAIVRELIARGADVNPKRPKGFAPLRAAVMRNRPAEAKLLLAAGARPALARDADGDPPVVLAAFRESLAVLRVLLAEPNSKADLSLALLEAAGLGNLPIVKLLVKHGADPTWRSARGNSALSIARKRKRREVVTYLASLRGAGKA